MIIDSIVVLYNPEEQSVLKNIEVISSKTNCCYVIVNSCDVKILEKISLIKGVVIINNNRNIGLSKSLNIGLREVINRNSEGVVLFDQDSLPSEFFFENIIACYQDLLKANTNVGAIGGLVHDDKKNEVIDDKSSLTTEVDVVITSGCLIPLSTINEVGLMDETFFIDYIDYEWCFRAKSKGFKIFISNHSILYHNLGDNLVGVLNVKKPIHDNVIRHYHIIKNQLIIVCRDYIPLKWRINHFFKIFYRIPGYIIYSSQRKKTIINIFKAIADFIKMDNKKKYTY
jgi:rhamnosyltransferase